ncbi:MAG: Undecaprenyl-phosphate alpha-N-acetylglucosaminyl 1-phosphate transferase [Candidatus Bipolaricaulis sibiricus]|uniref:Undecaprenyl-phosphate alpha-N-acetylglucosaminyl 1-phosphate transferase n=1 Tax=Bipolaricaulis sibiricus TaxID=2501609 RepID=A0A410FTC7_BIPS1|nr:MAG: Undecaprenyl-phosphate alpha-N-acetylglucosaminyl 1-phosphate transferase [Candidatus Bipolaricaulis sibiricus]
MIAVPFGVSLVATLVSTMILIRLCAGAGIVGRDVNKTGQPEVPEMGGLAIVAGFSAGILFTLGMITFLRLLPQVSMVMLLGVLSTVLLLSLIGVVDDLLGMHQGVKAFLPLLAALPLMALRVGQSAVWIPFVGKVNFWIWYPLVLVPLGVTGAANAVNMLAGFNGLEVGMGLVAMGSLAVIAGVLGQVTSLVLLLCGLGALLGILRFNWYRARIFVGDVGTLTMGAIIAAACIAGGLEVAGMILIVPYGVDFLFKAAHGFPSTGWHGELGEDGKLRCPVHGPVSLPQAMLKITGGLHEPSLVLLLMGLEAVFGLLAIWLYLLR